MAMRIISLDDYRGGLDVRQVVQQLTREGFEEGAVRRVIARIRLDCGGDVTMAQMLVWCRRQLDVESRVTIVRRR